MKRYGLLGAKLGHSYSAKIHNYSFNKLGITASYELIECLEDELPKYIAALKNGLYSGFNVTIPYKKTIMEYLDVIDEKALKIGSVNVVYYQDGKVIGTNTDYDGFYATIVDNKIEVKNKDCYVLGTGGASLAVSKVLEDLGGKITFVSRNSKENSISYNELNNRNIDLLINTTPVGMFPNIDACPVSEEVIKKAKVVIDIIFNPKQTKLLKMADSNYNGMYMLVVQALKAEEIWLNQKISNDILLEIIKGL